MMCFIQPLFFLVNFISTTPPSKAQQVNIFGSRFQPLSRIGENDISRNSIELVEEDEKINSVFELMDEIVTQEKSKSGLASHTPKLSPVINNDELKSKLRPLIAFAISDPQFSSLSLDDKVASLRKELSKQLDPGIRDRVIGSKRFDDHAKKLFVRASLNLARKGVITSSTSGTTKAPTTGIRKEVRIGSLFQRLGVSTEPISVTLSPTTSASKQISFSIPSQSTSAVSIKSTVTTQSPALLLRKVPTNSNVGPRLKNKRVKLLEKVVEKLPSHHVGITTSFQSRRVVKLDNQVSPRPTLTTTLSSKKVVLLDALARLQADKFRSVNQGNEIEKENSQLSKAEMFLPVSVVLKKDVLNSTRTKALERVSTSVSTAEPVANIVSSDTFVPEESRRVVLLKSIANSKSPSGVDMLSLSLLTSLSSNSSKFGFDVFKNEKSNFTGVALDDTESAKPLRKFETVHTNLLPINTFVASAEEGVTPNNIQNDSQARIPSQSLTDNQLRTKQNLGIEDGKILSEGIVTENILKHELKPEEVKFKSAVPLGGRESLLELVETTTNSFIRMIKNTSLSTFKESISVSRVTTQSSFTRKIQSNPLQNVERKRVKLLKKILHKFPLTDNEGKTPKIPIEELNQRLLTTSTTTPPIRKVEDFSTQVSSIPVQSSKFSSTPISKKKVVLLSPLTNVQKSPSSENVVAAEDESEFFSDPNSVLGTSAEVSKSEKEITMFASSRFLPKERSHVSTVTVSTSKVVVPINATLTGSVFTSSDDLTKVKSQDHIDTNDMKTLKTFRPKEFKSEPAVPQRMKQESKLTSSGQFMKKDDIVNAVNLAKVHASQIQEHMRKTISTNPGQKISTLTVVSSSTPKPTTTLTTALPTVNIGTSELRIKQESKLNSSSQLMKDDMVDAANLAKVYASQIQEHVRKTISTNPGLKVSTQTEVSSSTPKPTTTLAIALPTVDIGTSELRITTGETTSSPLLLVDTHGSSATSTSIFNPTTKVKSNDRIIADVTATKLLPIHRTSTAVLFLSSTHKGAVPMSQTLTPKITPATTIPPEIHSFSVKTTVLPVSSSSINAVLPVSSTYEVPLNTFTAKTSSIRTFSLTTRKLKIVPPLQQHKTRHHEVVQNKIKVKILSPVVKSVKSPVSAKKGKTFFSKVPYREVVRFQPDRSGGVSLVNTEGITLAHRRAGASIPLLNQLPAGLTPTIKITPVFISGVGNRGGTQPRRFF